MIILNKSCAHIITSKYLHVHIRRQFYDRIEKSDISTPLKNEAKPFLDHFKNKNNTHRRRIGVFSCFIQRLNAISFVSKYIFFSESQM